MEKTIPYCGDLHIDASTKKLILNLLRSIRSVVPVVDSPGPQNPEKTKGKKNIEELRRTVFLARIRSEELKGIFDPEELTRYVNYVSDYEEIISTLEQVLSELKICRDSALNFSEGMAEIIEEHLSLSSPPEDGIYQESDDYKLKVV